MSLLTLSFINELEEVGTVLAQDVDTAYLSVCCKDFALAICSEISPWLFEAIPCGKNGSLVVKLM